MPIRKYKALLEQSLNIGNIYRQQKFEFQDNEDKHNDFLNQIEYFKRKGRL